MNNNLCTDCGRAGITFQKVKGFETKIRGVPFTVPEAEIGVCNACGAKFFSPQEIRRWQRLYDAEQERTGRLLTAEQIRGLRMDLRMTIQSFAQLLGTTRQSVYNWERSDRKSPQLRIVDLLLRAIRESASNGTVDVVQFLREQSGVESTEEPPCYCPLRGRRRARRWHDPSEYDRAFNARGATVGLPSLRSY